MQNAASPSFTKASAADRHGDLVEAQLVGNFSSHITIEPERKNEPEHKNLPLRRVKPATNLLDLVAIGGRFRAPASNLVRSATIAGNRSAVDPPV
jgi:hypothetical protein